MVTEAEYESAILATRSCVEALGFRVGGIQTVTADGDRGFVYGGTQDPSLLDQADQCFEEYVGDVAAARAIQNAPTVAELSRIVAEFSECLLDGGYPHEPAPATRDEAIALSILAGDLGVECLRSVGLTDDVFFEHDIPAP